MDTKEHARLEAGMLDIWFFVGLNLFTYGLVIGIAGIFYAFDPPAVVLTELNPSLWWGVILAVSGALFLVTSWKRRAASIQAFEAQYGN